MKNDKGITMIALVITIIVMLLLASATIIVTLNTNIIQKTETITNQAEGISHNTQSKINGLESILVDIE